MDALAYIIPGCCCGGWIVVVLVAVAFFKGASRDIGRRDVMPPRER